MSALKELLKRALAKTSDSSEGKLLAEFIQDLLDDNEDDPAHVAGSMEEIIAWATLFKDAARRAEEA